MPSIASSNEIEPLPLAANNQSIGKMIMVLTASRIFRCMPVELMKIIPRTIMAICMYDATLVKRPTIKKMPPTRVAMLTVAAITSRKPAYAPAPVRCIVNCSSLVSCVNRSPFQIKRMPSVILIKAIQVALVLAYTLTQKLFQ